MSKRVTISSLGICLPERRISNDEMPGLFGIDTSDEWIRSHTGIGWRHIAADDESNSDLAAAAAKQALERAGVDARDVDIIILATTTPDYFGCPATSCIIQDKIGAKGAMAFDLTAACSGFVYGVEVANSLLHSGQGKRALVIGSETLSRVVDWSDRNTCVLFGDGAGAALLELGDDTGRGVTASRLKAYGAGWQYIVMRDGGSVNPYDKETMGERNPPVLEMAGRKVYAFAVKVIPEIMGELTAKAGIEQDEIKWIVPHQANGRIISAAAGHMKFPESRFFTNLEQRANTSSASIPIALYELEQQGGLESGDLVALVGFGSGLTAAGTLIRW